MMTFAKQTIASTASKFALATVAAAALATMAAPTSAEAYSFPQRPKIGGGVCMKRVCTEWAWPRGGQPFAGRCVGYTLKRVSCDSTPLR